MLYQLSVIFVLAVAWVLIARRAALVVGLVDKPNARKQHLGHIPLVGGIAVYLTLMLMTLWQPAWLPDSAVYLLCVTALVVLGVLDDRFDLPVAPRVMVQGGIALAMMLAAGMQLSSLGYVWGHQEVMLGYGALLLTPLAVWGRSTPKHGRWHRWAAGRLVLRHLRGVGHPVRIGRPGRPGVVVSGPDRRAGSLSAV